MSNTRYLLSGVILSMWAAGSVSAQVHGRPPPANVAPVDEITVFDPASNSEFKPSPVLYSGPDGQQHVDIPPAVIVHNFYYTGDRDFRGPRFPGGPSIVVVNHPLSGGRQYLEVQMLAGAPRVTYRKEFIDYDFGSQRIRLRFLHPLKPCSDPTVSYLKGRGFADTTNPVRVKSQTHLGGWLARTGLVHATEHAVHGAVNVLDTSADRIKDAGTIAVAPVVRIVQSTPIAGLLTSSPEERAQRARDIAVQKAEQANRVNDLTIPTLR